MSGGEKREGTARIAEALERYVNGFSRRHNVREMDTIDQIAFLAKGLVGEKLSYKEFTS